MLHASAVLASSGACVCAFCGTSESGKSTIAYGLAARGYTHWADDSLAFRTCSSQPPIAVRLPFTIKLRPPTAAYFSAEAKPSVVSGQQERERRLGGIFLLDPVDGDTRGELFLDELSPSVALKALLPNSFRFRPQDRDRRDATMRSYLDVVASVPILSVRYTRGLEDLPALLTRLERAIRDVT